MATLIRSVVLLGIISTVACGATANGGTVQTTPSGRPPVIQPSGPAEVNTSARGVIPAGQEMDVRLQSSLSSETAKVEQRFDATTAVDLMQNGRVLVPAGAVVHGVVSAVDPAGRLADRTGKHDAVVRSDDGEGSRLPDSRHGHADLPERRYP